MSTNVSRSQKVAVFTFFSLLIILLLGVMLVTGAFEGLVTKKSRLHVAFSESVTGLQIGSAVTLSGVKVGEVVKIEPVTTGKSREVLKNANILYHKRAQKSRRGTVMDGSVYLEKHRPDVLVTVEVREDSIPMNLSTHAMLVTTNLAGSQAVRFTTNERNSIQKLVDQPVVVNADFSPFVNLKERLLEREKGLLNENNVENIHALIKNLRNVSGQLSTLLKEENKKSLTSLVESHRKVASRLNRWMAEGNQNQKTPPGARKREQADGKLTRILNRMDRLLKQMNKLVEPGQEQPRIPELMASFHQMSRDFRRTSHSVRTLVSNNRKMIKKLLKNVNRLSTRLNAVALQIEQDPSSVLFGRRGSEIQSPFEDQ